MIQNRNSSTWNRRCCKFKSAFLIHPDQPTVHTDELLKNADELGTRKNWSHMKFSKRSESRWTFGAALCSITVYGNHADIIVAPKLAQFPAPEDTTNIESNIGATNMTWRLVYIYITPSHQKLRSESQKVVSWFHRDSVAVMCVDLEHNGPIVICWRLLCPVRKYWKLMPSLSCLKIRDSKSIKVWSPLP